MSGYDCCPNCGGDIYDDGYTSPRRCENAEEEHWWYNEPDCPVVLCKTETVLGYV